MLKKPNWFICTKRYCQINFDTSSTIFKKKLTDLVVQTNRLCSWWPLKYQDAILAWRCWSCHDLRADQIRQFFPSDKLVYKLMNLAYLCLSIDNKQQCWNDFDIESLTQERRLFSIQLDKTSLEIFGRTNVQMLVENLTALCSRTVKVNNSAFWVFDFVEEVLFGR